MSSSTNDLVACGSGRVRCKVDRDDALMYVGYAGQELAGGLRGRFEELACRCEELCEVSYAWRVEEIDASSRFGELMPQVVLAGSGLVLEGADISRHLSGARYVAIFACTLGLACERELKRLGAVSALDHLLFDCCASSLAEAGAQSVQEILGKEATELGLLAHARFSPGYGDLSLDVQPAFLDALDAGRRLGMTVTKNNFLLPTKSVTAVLGFFDDEVSYAVDPCSLCAAREYCCYLERGTTCRQRRAK